jgi:hypothetical protein
MKHVSHGRGKRGLRMTENKMLKAIYEAKVDFAMSFMVCTLNRISLKWSVQGEWGHVARMGEWRSTCTRILVGNPDGETTWVTYAQRRGKYYNVSEIMWCEDVDWINLDQRRDQWLALVITVMKFQAPSKAGNFATSWVNDLLLQTDTSWSIYPHMVLRVDILNVSVNY